MTALTPEQRLIAAATIMRDAIEAVDAERDREEDRR